MALLLYALILQPGIQPEDLESRVYFEINSIRRYQGLQPLIMDAGLSEIARSHSREMASRRFFSHQSLDGKTPSERARRAGYRCARIGENIFRNNLYSRVIRTRDRTTFDWNTAKEIAKTTIDGWMKSSGHRKNILQDAFNRTGIGVAISDDGKVLITQIFCRHTGKFRDGPDGP